jgi:DNA-binding CsgD family transcriptional regulator
VLAAARQHAIGKTGARNRVEAIRAAEQRGWL